MTRRRDIMCEDIFGCSHEPEIPVSDDGQIIVWRCRCGQVEKSVDLNEATNLTEKKPDGT